MQSKIKLRWKQQHLKVKWFKLFKIYTNQHMVGNQTLLIPVSLQKKGWFCIIWKQFIYFKSGFLIGRWQRVGIRTLSILTAGLSHSMPLWCRFTLAQSKFDGWWLKIIRQITPLWGIVPKWLLGSHPAATLHTSLQEEKSSLINWSNMVYRWTFTAVAGIWPVGIVTTTKLTSRMNTVEKWHQRITNSILLLKILFVSITSLKSIYLFLSYIQLKFFT